MKKKRRKTYTSAFKVKVALEAIEGRQTINDTTAFIRTW
jgi:transposase-like protein